MGVKKSATTGQIRRKFRKLSLELHPDKAENASDEANRKKRFEEVNQAYEILGDAEKRQAFDGFGASGGFQTREEFEAAAASGAGTEAAAGTGDLYSGSKLIRSLSAWDISPAAQRRLKRPLLVEYYASWCGHCQHLAPAIRRLSILFEDKIDFGAINCETKERICRQQGISGYPTLTLLMSDGSKDTYAGPLDAGLIETWMRDAADSKLRTFDRTSDYLQVAKDGSKPLLVSFSLPQCGPCQQFKPSMRRAARQLEGIVEVATGDCSSPAMREACQGVPYFPYLVLIPPGTPDPDRHWKVLTEDRRRMSPADQALNIAMAVIEAVVPGAQETMSGQGGGEQGGSSDGYGHGDGFGHPGHEDPFGGGPPPGSFSDEWGEPGDYPPGGGDPYGGGGGHFQQGEFGPDGEWQGEGGGQDEGGWEVGDGW